MMSVRTGRACSHWTLENDDLIEFCLRKICMVDAEMMFCLVGYIVHSVRIRSFQCKTYSEAHDHYCKQLQIWWILIDN